MLCRTLTCIVTGAGWNSSGTGSTLLFDGDGVTLPSFRIPDGVKLCDGTILLAE